MAGILPGVEIARRRRVHGSEPSNGSTRRSSFCLYSSNHEFHISSSSSMQQRSIINHAYTGEKLRGVAREAKERLDEKLRAQWKSETKRTNSQERLRGIEENSMVLGDLHTEVFGLKKPRGSKRFGWAKMGWKASEQEECAVCLEQYKSGEYLMHLPCAHRFHSRCLVPWLENNAQCPCCRMGILI